MNLSLTQMEPEEILEWLTLLEGDVWKREQERDGKKELGFWAAVEIWEQQKNEPYPFRNDPEGAVTWPENVVATIYGLGGNHRFYVKRNGQVCFSKHHAGARYSKNTTGKLTRASYCEDAVAIGCEIF